MTTALACFLDDAGVKVDLTVEPGLPGMSGLVPGELTTGWIPSTFNAPTYPYHPSRFDFRVPDSARDEGLLLVPLTRGLDVTVDWEVGRPRGRWDTLALFDQPDRFRRRIRLRLADPALTHLAFAIRSDLPLRSELWSSFEANLAELCRHPAARELAFCTASDAVHEGLFEADRGGPAAQSRTSSLARAGLWARGDEDPGYIEAAELEAVRVLNHAITDGRAELTAEIAKGSQVGQWFEAASRELQAMRETKTWRAHDQAVSLVAAIRARLRRR